LYYANASLDKLQWEYIVGGVAFLAVFVPDYGHFRSGAVIGILTTTITSLYMFIASLSIGQVLSLSLLPLLQLNLQVSTFQHQECVMNPWSYVNFVISAQARQRPVY
jgi:predicted membrane-bound spermidine synthase